MHSEIQPAPFIGQCVKGRLRAGIVLHVIIQHKIHTHIGRQRFDFLTKDIHLHAKGQFCTLGLHSLRDAPSNGAIICNSGDQTAFSFKKFCHDFIR